jgi:uncharacterized protein YjdB
MVIFEKLTPRENQVANLVLECLSDKEIAPKLNITERTVAYHMDHIYRKYGFEIGQDHSRTMRSKIVLRLAKAAGVLAACLILCVVPARAQNSAKHSATITWDQPTQPTGEVITSTNIYRDSNMLANVPVVMPEYVDSAVNTGETHAYSLSNVDTMGVESALSVPPITVTIPGSAPPPPTCTTIAVGCRISVNSTANIRATAPNNAFGALLGTEPGGALGTVTIVSTATIPNCSGCVWIQVHFDTCTGAALVAAKCQGYMGSNNMTLVNTAPVVAVAITPKTAALTIGQSQQFTAVVTNATDTSATWSSDAPGGLFAASTSGTFTVTATSNADSTKSATATVTVTAPAPNPTVSTSGNIITLVPTNIPPGTAYTCSIVVDKVTVTCSGLTQ